MKHYAYESPFKMKDPDGNLYTLKVETEDDPLDPRQWSNVSTMVCWHRHYRLGDKHAFETPDEFMQHLYLDVTGTHWCDQHNTDDWEEVLKELQESDLVLIKPLNLYDHGGITISTSSGYPYNDRWDAGCVGFVFITKKTALENLGGIPKCDDYGKPVMVVKKLSNGKSVLAAEYEPISEDNWKQVAEYCIDEEVETYDQYLRGDVYGYQLLKTVVEQQKCPHCGEVLREYEIEEEVDSCGGFYGSCLEENGIFDNIPDLQFIEN